MCGLVALFRRDGEAVGAQQILAMRDTLRHRGPDDAGMFLDGPVGLGHRRLRVIDLTGGHQPMTNPDGTIHVVFNGEIYNYRELRSHLQEKGLPVRTQSDTETIIGLYQLYGDEVVSHLRGMFAFALWDTVRRRLVLARDRMGIKPLYIARVGSTIAVASEIKALFASGLVRPSVSEDTIPEYLLRRTLVGTRTMFQGIQRVAPGQILTFTASSEHNRQYWQLPVPVEADHKPRPEAEWAEELDEILKRVVKAHLLSDVPVGTFNSGGVDSSLITAYAARSSAERLNTYSIGFEDPSFDERPYAHLVAERFATNHHAEVISGHQFAEYLPRAIWHHDEPLNHPHSVQLAYLSLKAREKVTVVLTGEGSDELFAGYPRYRLARAMDLAGPAGRLLFPVLRLGLTWVQRRAATRVRASLNAQGGCHVEGLSAFVETDSLRRILQRDLLKRWTPQGPVPPAKPPFVLAQALHYDQSAYLQSLLDRLDKMSMLASLEGRVPFLDHEVVEFAARVPPQLKIRGLTNKYIIKRVAQRYLPPSVVNRKKAGFAVPISSWLRRAGPMADYVDILLEPRTLDRGYFIEREIARVVDEHRGGSRDNGELLWVLINLELWHRLMIDQPVHMTSASAGYELRPPAQQGQQQHPQVSK